MRLYINFHDIYSQDSYGLSLTSMQEPFVLPQESLQRNGRTGVEATDLCFAVSISVASVFFFKKSVIGGLDSRFWLNVFIENCRGYAWCFNWKSRCIGTAVHGIPNLNLLKYLMTLAWQCTLYDGFRLGKVMNFSHLVVWNVCHFGNTDCWVPIL